MLGARFKSEGRGRYYTPLRGMMESSLRVAYTGGWPARVWARVPSATRVRRVHHVRKLERDLGFERLRVAFASDLHVGPTTPLRTLEVAFDSIAEMRPDVLLLGGDYVFLDIKDHTLDAIDALLDRVRSSVTFAVLGNHDLWSRHDLLERRFAERGVELLSNRSARLPEPFARVSVHGLDDPWTGSPDPQGCLSDPDGPESGLRLGLCHSPDGVHYLKGSPLDLLICGHTHGGQVALPGNRPIVLPPGPYSRRLVAGHYSVEGLDVFVSRGLGGTELPVRTYASPEIAIFDWVRPSSV